MNNNDVSHDGHRQRLLETVTRVGLENLSDVQIVEFMLTYIFPRGDVNPLAHRLLDTFSTIGGIIDADYQLLMGIKGINERTAKKIAALSDVFFAYTSSRMRSQKKFRTEADIIDLIEVLLRFRTRENLVFLGFTNAGFMCGSKRFVSEKISSVQITSFDLTAFLASYRPDSVVVAHNHPFGVASPSPDDDKSKEVISKICFDCGVNFIDAYIVGENGVYSQKESALRRQYCDVGDLSRLI